jgi:hypothetical protein
MENWINNTVASGTVHTAVELMYGSDVLMYSTRSCQRSCDYSRTRRHCDKIGSCTRKDEAEGSAKRNKTEEGKCKLETKTKCKNVSENTTYV